MFSDARYEDRGLLGQGGMGEVRLVYDCELKRTLAMKILHTELAHREQALSRFVQEAQATAQLQHPNIVPIHDFGQLHDGRCYFTMRAVEGHHLGQVIHQVHEVSEGEWRRTASGWSLHRMISALHQASRAVAYAHYRGVLHRDLKPENVMVGNFGEVLVMDWGLAKIGEGQPMDGVITDRAGDGRRTETGHIAGTPAFMPPEQARGKPVDARSDVYSLGAILYEMMSGRAPYTGSGPLVILHKVIAGPPPPPNEHQDVDGAETMALSLPTLRARAERASSFDFAPEPPEDLVEVCMRAMQRAPSSRYPTATAFADELEAWLDGARRRQQALEIVSQAAERRPRVVQMRQQAATLSHHATELIRGIPMWAQERDKLVAWNTQEEADELEHAADLLELEADQLLKGALTHAPDLPEAHAALAERYLESFIEAEQHEDRWALTKAEVQLRTHLDLLPHTHETRQSCLRTLAGHGALTLITDPPGAEVWVARYTHRHHRLVEVAQGTLGHTPLHEVELEMGSYLLQLRVPGRTPVRYPVCIGRREHWHGVRPGDREPTPVPVPEAVPDGSLVSAGWFQVGHAQDYAATPPGSLWCDGFVIQTFPVTNAEYITFLDDLCARGRHDEAMRHVPRLEGGERLYGFANDRFFLQPDPEGDLWPPTLPVIYVDWYGAAAYASWMAERTGLPWRLPSGPEWEKAARGVDGRMFPWGPDPDASYFCYRDSHRDHPMPRVVDSFPIDQSPYGVRGLAGNVADWCLDPWSRATQLPEDGLVRAPPVGQSQNRLHRGGHWLGNSGNGRLAYRSGSHAEHRVSHLGFRLLRPLS